MEVLALCRTAGVFSEPQNLMDKPIFHQALAPSERRPRAELIRVANLLEGMEQGTDKNTRAPVRVLHLLPGSATPGITPFSIRWQSSR
jgi:hypothetical protein